MTKTETTFEPSSADGFFIGGCHTPSGCHHIAGNFKVQRRFMLLKKLLPQFGIEPERLRLDGFQLPKVPVSLRS